MNYYWCPMSMPQCNPVARGMQSAISFAIDEWQIAFLIGVAAVVLLLCVVMTGAAIYSLQRGRA